MLRSRRLSALAAAQGHSSCQGWGKMATPKCGKAAWQNPLAPRAQGLVLTCNLRIALQVTTHTYGIYTYYHAHNRACSGCNPQPTKTDSSSVAPAATPALLAGVACVNAHTGACRRSSAMWGAPWGANPLHLRPGVEQLWLALVQRWLACSSGVAQRCLQRQALRAAGDVGPMYKKQCNMMQYVVIILKRVNEFCICM